MTPSARYQAAIEVLDAIQGGLVAEQALSRWGRSHRFAGSKDRAKIRDHVFDVIRKNRSCAAAGGGTSGRDLVLGLLRITGIDPTEFFTGEGYAPKELSPETESDHPEVSEQDTWDLPDWLITEFQNSLGEQAHEVAEVLRERAPVFVRVNLLKATIAEAQTSLQREDIESELCDTSPTALKILSNPRRVSLSRAYQDGLVELQDAASQAVIDALPITQGMKILDYCAGGGGKALAMAARSRAQVAVHDIDKSRMQDIPERARRAGADLVAVDTPTAGFDLVLCDVPCSGAGTWRRAPEAKWSFTPERLEKLTEIQSQILESASELVRSGGVLAYVTCSVLRDENEDRISSFLRDNPSWSMTEHHKFHPGDSGDGLFVASLLKG